MSSNLQDDNQTGRQTGAGALFLNRVKLAAQQKITDAKAARANALADAHQRAHTASEVAQTRALEQLSQNLKKIYLRVYDGPVESNGSWLEIDANGSVNKLPSFGYDAAFDEANQHVYFSAVKRRFPKGRSDFCWHLVSTRMDGTDVKTLGTRLIRNDQNGGIAFDENQGAIFWIGGDGVILRTDILGNFTDISGTTTSQVLDIDPTAVGQPDLPSCIALDKVRQKIYWAHNGTLGVVNYDGLEAKVIFDRGHIDTNGVMSLTVDSKLERICWTNNGTVNKANVDGSHVSRSIWKLGSRTSTSFWHVALDTSNQVLYSYREGSEFSFYMATIDSDLSPAGASATEFTVNSLRMYEKAGFSLIADGWFRASRLVLLTSTDEVNQKLTSATAKLNSSRAAAPQMIVQAHQDAAQTIQNAHSALDAAHTKAANDISAKNQEAVRRRQAAGALADAKHAEAAQKISDANQDAAQTVQDAHNAAQSKINQKQQEAAAIKQPAQARLDDARRAQQNS